MSPCPACAAAPASRDTQGVVWAGPKALIPGIIGSTGFDPSFVASVNRLLDEPAPRSFFEELDALRI